MTNYNKFNSMQARIFVALVCGLFISAIHAETMPPDAVRASAASAVAVAPTTGEVAPSAVGAASGVAAVPGEVVVSAIGAASGVAAAPAAGEAAASGVAAAPAAGEAAASGVAAAPAAGEAAASGVAAAPAAGGAAASGVAATPEVAAAPAAPLSPFEELLQLCAGCHNPDGNSVIPENPKLSGLHKKYIRQQMEDFKSGDRKNDTMGAIIMGVEEDKFEDLAEYFSDQKRSVNVSDKPELVAQGQQIFEEGVIGTAAPACMGCHGEDGSGSKKFPRLNGQNALYVVNQMMGFKNGTRTNDAKGLMQAVAKRLSEQDIVAVAEYMSTLKEIE